MNNNSFSFTDFYISFNGQQRYNDVFLIEDDIIRIIVQKYEMILNTDKGEVLSDINFGAGLESLLHDTRLSAEHIQNDIERQIIQYIPEIADLDFTLEVGIHEHPTEFMEYMTIKFSLKEYEVYAVVN